MAKTKTPKRRTSAVVPPPAAAAPATPPVQPVAITIPRIDTRTMRLTLVGESPLISHAWSKKAVDQMLAKQMKKPQEAKAAKDPWADFCDSLYWLSSRKERPTGKDVEHATFGFPCVAFKNAAVGACRFADGIKMTEARGAFHVIGEFATIEGAAPSMRQDMVRVGQGTADVRFRGEFNPWKVTLDISYNAAALSPEQIVNLFNVAGFGVGVGEWRPEKDGSYGRFRVE